MNINQPLISIVIANYNYGRFLETAIQSVLNQCVQTEGHPLKLSSGDEIELIIVDGCSSDNSVEIIKKYADKLAWWCSEKDHGQSHAFNKGFHHSRGRFLTWLNADDVLLPNTLCVVSRKIRNHPACDWFTGNFYRFVNDGTIVEMNWGPHIYPCWLQRPNSPVVVFGPTSFFSSRIYKLVGGMNESLHFMMDIDLWIRFMNAGIKQQRVNHFCWAFRLHEDSKTGEFGEWHLNEQARAKFKLEAARVMKSNGYRMSKMLRILSLAMRMIDGSWVWGSLLRVIHKNRKLALSEYD